MAERPFATALPHLRIATICGHARSRTGTESRNVYYGEARWNSPLASPLTPRENADDEAYWRRIESFDAFEEWQALRSTWPAGTAGGRGTDSVLICFSQGFQSPELQPSFDVSSPDFL
jgi:hypothetical protein